jgi:hypothetical protein
VQVTAVEHVGNGATLELKHGSRLI